MRYFILFCALVSCAAGYFLADTHDYHWEPYAGDAATGAGAWTPSPAPAYDVKGLDDLVGRLGKKSLLSIKQAHALASLWHITEADLDSPIDIYGEKHHVR